MAENTFKIKTESGRSIFARIEDFLKVNDVFADGLPVRYAPHVLFFSVMGVFYVGNTHYAESTQRKINRVQAEVEDLRADYTTLKADYMYARLQSEVARRLKKNGIVENENPPTKIVISKK